MRSALAHLAAAVVLTVSATACDRTRIVPQVDAGPLCSDGERLVNGECRFVCDRDSDCPTGERCDLLLGRCVTRPPPPVDSGTPPIPCTEGAVRCAVDGLALEACDATGAWVVQQQCAQPDGFCQNELCLACRPGAERCAANGTVAQLCASDGSGWRDVTCAMGATCVAGQCRECELGQRRCSPDGVSVQECKPLPREDLSLGYVNSGDNFDGTCITRVCEQGAGGPQCRTPACVPGATQCLNTTTQQTCNAQGAYTNVTCSTLPGMGATAECLNGACVDECGDAVRGKSYFGCEYWSAVMDNSIDPLFKAGTQSGQGSADSDFVFVVTNQSASPAQVEVWRYSGSAPVRIKNVTLPGRNDAATRGLMKIAVPWQSIGPASAQVGIGTTGKARYAYRLTSTKPVTVYQFNPVDAVKYTKSCSGTAGLSDCSCNELADFDSLSCLLGLGGNPGICANTANGKRCAYNTYSNDASLLLPAHILGTSYVVLGVQHVQTDTGNPNAIMSPVVTVVATQDATQVTVKSSAATAAGTGVASFAVGETRTITLNAFEVLQLATTNRTGVNLQCAGGWCRVNNDFTGTVVTSDKPIAVFSGSPCVQVPFSRSACDHVEEQMFPFETWGKTFVAVPSHPLRLNNNSFASNPPPDHFKIVAACPASQCPNGTTITLSTAPAASAVLAPNNCVSGTSLQANNCRLMGGQYIEFQSRNPFTVSADQPIAVAQFLPGQGSLTGVPTDPAQGDPSMILLPPVEQWRSRYTVLASTGLRDNYLSLAIDSTKVQAVTVDGVPVSLTPGPAPSDAKQVPGTGFVTKQHPVGTGTHTLAVTPKPGQTQLPGAGVTVYGFDSYVSYGYTGGLDLTTIVTGINPGG